jgi:hypothetical protein
VIVVVIFKRESTDGNKQTDAFRMRRRSVLPSLGGFVCRRRRISKEGGFSSQKGDAASSLLWPFVVAKTYGLLGGCRGLLGGPSDENSLRRRSGEGPAVLPERRCCEGDGFWEVELLKKLPRFPVVLVLVDLRLLSLSLSFAFSISSSPWTASPWKLPPAWQPGIEEWCPLQL